MAEFKRGKTQGFRDLPWAGILAIAMLAAALFAAMRVAGWNFGMPISLAGSSLSKVAQEFNALGFVAPGALMAFQALRSRLTMHQAAKRGERLALWVWMISALAFAAMGVRSMRASISMKAATDGMPWPGICGGRRLHWVAWRPDSAVNPDCDSLRLQPSLRFF